MAGRNPMIAPSREETTWTNSHDPVAMFEWLVRDPGTNDGQEPSYLPSARKLRFLSRAIAALADWDKGRSGWPYSCWNEGEPDPYEHKDNAATPLQWLQCYLKDAPTEKWPETAALLRCVFGNPFQPVAVRKEWIEEFQPGASYLERWTAPYLTPAVLAIAQTIYDQRTFTDMGVLADALEEAGCNHADLLDHCRGPGPHCRGCHVLDLILGKE